MGKELGQMLLLLLRDIRLRDRIVAISMNVSDLRELVTI